MAFPQNPRVGDSYFDVTVGKMFTFLGGAGWTSPSSTDLPVDIAQTGDDETITGEWTFEQPIVLPVGSTMTTESVQLENTSLSLTNNVGSGNPGIVFSASESFEIRSNNTTLAIINSSGALRVNGSYGTSGQILSSRGPNASLQWINAPTGTGSLTGSLTFNNSGAGAASGSSFNGTSSITVSYNTLGATTIGASLFTAASAQAGRAALGATTIGASLFTAASQEAGRAALNTDIYSTVPIATTGSGKVRVITANFTLNSGELSGTVIPIYNNSDATISIIAGAGVTLRLAGSTMTGTRTLAPRGLASVWAFSSTEYVISGQVY